jgi:hypothetical protein
MQDVRGMHGIVEIAHEEERFSACVEPRERLHDRSRFGHARRLARGAFRVMPLVREMGGGDEDGALRARELQPYPEEPAVPGFDDAYVFGAVFQLDENALAPVDVAFAAPPDEAVVHSVVTGEHRIQRLTRPGAKLLQAEHVRVEQLEEAREGRRAQLPALGVPDVVGDEAEAHGCVVRVRRALHRVVASFVNRQGLA